LKFKNKNINIGSMLIRWLISYILILMIPLIFNGIVYVKSSNILEDEINRVNMGMLKQLQSTIDGRLTEVESLTQQISLNLNINSLKASNAKLEDFQQYNVYKAVQNLRVYQSSNSYIDNIYIYLKQHKTLLTQSSYIDAQLSYDYSFKYMNISYDEWIKFLNNPHRKDMVKLKLSEATKGYEDQIAYVQSLPLESPDSSFATLVIPISARKLQDAIEAVQSVNEGTTLIIDNHDKILVSTQEVSGLDKISFDKLTQENGVVYDTVNGKDVVISYISSKVNSWKYITIVPSKVFLDKLTYIHLINRVSIFLCILLGGLVTLFFLRKNYTPINNIVKKLRERTDRSIDKEKDELGFIMNAVSRAFDDNDKINERLEVQNKEVRASFLRRILRGHLNNNLSFDDSLSAFGIKLLSDKFVVLVFCIEKYDQLFYKHVETTDKTKLEYTKFILVNVIEELADQKNQGFMVEVDEKMYACLINLKEQDDTDANKETLRIANDAQKFIQETFKINFNVSISNIHSTIAGISQAYQEAIEVIEYKNMVGYAEIMNYSEISSTKYPKNSYFYPIETEYQLINTIKAGEFKKAVNILENIFTNNFSSKPSSLKIAKCFMFNLISTMLKVLDEINNLYNDNLTEELSSIDELLKCKTTLEMKNTLVDIIRNICNYVLSQKKHGHEELTENIVTFVKNNYNDINFSLAMIGEKFEMTPSYLSKIFMEETGEGLLDLITRYRLDKAKLLLKEKKLSVNEIAFEVGFSNSGSFIRTFKRHEGITPGKY